MSFDQANRDEWRAYLAERKGTYEYRTKRYGAVADELERLGLEDGDLIVDVGAGQCEFAKYMYQHRGWSGQYLPVDGSIDGLDLEGWAPHLEADFFVAIELIEHLHSPARLLADLRTKVRKGIVITTPHTDVLGERVVREMDRTHVTPITRMYLQVMAVSDVKTLSCFGQTDDTLIGIWRNQ